MPPEVNAKGCNSQVHDISWAPDVGRSYHLVAVATKNTLCIWRLQLVQATNELEPTLVANLDGHSSEVSDERCGEASTHLMRTLLSRPIFFLVPGLAVRVECDGNCTGFVWRRRARAGVAQRLQGGVALRDGLCERLVLLLL